MRQAGLTGLAVVLSLLGGAPRANAQVQPLAPAVVPSGPPPVAASGFTPAPVPSHPPASLNPGASIQPAAPDATMGPGSARLRLNGSVTTYVGVSSQR